MDFEGYNHLALIITSKLILVLNTVDMKTVKSFLIFYPDLYRLCEYELVEYELVLMQNVSGHGFSKPEFNH